MKIKTILNALANTFLSINLVILRGSLQDCDHIAVSNVSPKMLIVLKNRHAISPVTKPFISGS